MYAMFYGASPFNSDVSSWDVSHVVRMAWMFSYASVSTAMSDDLDLFDYQDGVCAAECW